MKIKHLILLAVICIQMSACTNSALFFANSLARLGDYTLESDVHYGPNPLNKLDIYKPDGVAKGIIIFFYGGCWGACETYPKSDYRFVAQALTSLGYSVVIPDYRLYPQVKFLDIMDDARSAFQWVTENQHEFNLESTTLILMGHSAGAHIAAMLAANESYLGESLYTRLSGFIGLAGPYDFLFDQPYQYLLFSELDYADTQPSSFIDGTEVPMLLLHGDSDKKVYLRNINNMRRKIEENNGSVQAKIYQGVNHGEIIAALSAPLRGRYAVIEDVSAFLKQLNDGTSMTMSN